MTCFAPGKQTASEAPHLQTNPLQCPSRQKQNIMNASRQAEGSLETFVHLLHDIRRQRADAANDRVLPDGEDVFARDGGIVQQFSLLASGRRGFDQKLCWLRFRETNSRRDLHDQCVVETPIVRVAWHNQRWPGLRLVASVRCLTHTNGRDLKVAPFDVSIAVQSFQNTIDTE